MICRCPTQLIAALLLLALLQASTSEPDLDPDLDRDAPGFISGLPTNVTRSAGDSAELLCGVQQLGTRTVYWWKDGDDYPLTVDLHTFVPARRITVQHKSGVYWNLHIEQLTPNDAGTYICKVSTSPTMQRAVTLHVTPNTHLPLRETSVDYKIAQSKNDALLNANVAISNKTPPPHFVDDRLFLECSVAASVSVSASAPLNKSGYMCDIEWFHNGLAMLRDMHRRDVLITLPASSVHCRSSNAHAIVSTLVIAKLRTKHSGKYFCSFTVVPVPVLRSLNDASLLFSKQSAMIDVHVNVRTRNASVLTAPLQSDASRESPSASASPQRLAVLCLLTLYTYRWLTLV